MHTANNHFDYYEHLYSDESETAKLDSVVKKSIKSANPDVVFGQPYKVTSEIDTAKNPIWIFSNEAVILVAIVVIITVVSYCVYIRKSKVYKNIEST